MKLNTNKTKVITAFIMLFTALSALVFSVFVYAWFGSTWSGNRPFGVTTGDYPAPTMQAWKYTISNEDIGDTIVKTGIWEVASSSDYVIDHITTRTQTASNMEKYSFSSLHLGTVDNLLDLSKDNVFYIRFYVPATPTAKSKARAKYALSENDILFYDLDGNEYTYNDGTPIVGSGSLLIDFSKFVEIINVDVAASDTAYDPTTFNADSSCQDEDIAALFAVEKDAEHPNGYVTLVNGADFADAFDAEKTSGYYLYVRISPNLKNCMEATDSIATLMPCELVFGITLEMEFYQPYQAASPVSSSDEG